MLRSIDNYVIVPKLRILKEYFIGQFPYGKRVNQKTPNVCATQNMRLHEIIQRFGDTYSRLYVYHQYVCFYTVLTTIRVVSTLQLIPNSSNQSTSLLGSLSANTPLQSLLQRTPLAVLLHSLLSRHHPVTVLASTTHQVERLALATSLAQRHVCPSATSARTHERLALRQPTTRSVERLALGNLPKKIQQGNA